MGPETKTIVRSLQNAPPHISGTLRERRDYRVRTKSREACDEIADAAPVLEQFPPSVDLRTLSHDSLTPDLAKQYQAHLTLSLKICSPERPRQCSYGYVAARGEALLPCKRAKNHERNSGSTTISGCRGKRPES